MKNEASYGGLAYDKSNNFDPPRACKAPRERAEHARSRMRFNSICARECARMADTGIISLWMLIVHARCVWVCYVYLLLTAGGCIFAMAHCALRGKCKLAHNMGMGWGIAKAEIKANRTACGTMHRSRVGLEWVFRREAESAEWIFARVCAFYNVFVNNFNRSLVDVARDMRSQTKRNENPDVF